MTEIESFTDHSWVDYFGERIIWQLPDEMTFGLEEKSNSKQSTSFSYLMLFKDRNRIDLTLFSKDKIKTDFRPESLAIIWLDKDNIFSNFPDSSDFDHLVKKTNRARIY
ncbi:MAG: aminoglycoside 6-adenylyltransferase [Cyclobacteriaceae bacterium]|nr:aminoglycoside 6-adenylyltransferase [Cyclobacteriaceae bacterium]